MCSRHLSDLIQKVLDISKFKTAFKKNPEEFFTSRKLFVTFKSSTDAWRFKTMYNNGYKFKWSNILKSMPLDLKQIQLNTKRKKDIQTELLEEFSTLNSLNITNKQVDLSQDSITKSGNIKTESI